jgi:hypothetical protein
MFYLMANELTKYGLFLDQDEELQKYYSELRGIIVKLSLNPNISGMILDLNALPTDPLNLKEAVIKWIIQVNLPRLNRGEDPITTLELMLKCPVWKVIQPPLRRISLEQKKLLNRPSNKNKSQKAAPGSINKK